MFDDLDLEIEEVEELPKQTSKNLKEELEHAETHKQSSEFVLDKKFPYLEITIDEESRMTRLTKEALDTAFGQKRAQELNTEEIEERLQSTRKSSVTVGVSIDGNEKVLGEVDVTRLRYVYSLVRHLKLALHLEDGSKLSGSHVLAFI